MGKAFLKNTIKTNRPLMEAIIAFHCRTVDAVLPNATPADVSSSGAPVSDVSVSGTPASGTQAVNSGNMPLSTAGFQLQTSGALQAIMQSRRGKARIAANIGAVTEAIPQNWFTDFMEPQTRLALLDKATLLRLADHLGLALNAQEIARTILKSQVVALKETFGDAGYTFAVKRAPFLLSDLDSLTKLGQALEKGLSAASGNTSGDTLGDTTAATGGNGTNSAPANTSAKGTARTALAERARHQGCLGIALCLADEAAPLRQWLAAALPAELLDTQHVQLSTRGKTLLWKSVYRILTKEVAPQWAPCFA